MVVRKPNRRVLQEDVARAAGVAVSTVSRALRNPDRINAGTAERIQAMASRLGYVTSGTAADDATEPRHGLLMMLVKDTSDGVSSRILKGAQLAALESNRVVGVIETGQSGKRSIRILDTLQHHVDGLILSTDQIDVETILRIAGKLPVVVVNRPVEHMRSVIPNPLVGVTRMLQLFQRYGLHDIAYVSGNNDSWANRSRWECLHLMARKMGFSLHQIGAVSASVEGGFQAAIALENALPDAIVAFNDLIASGIVLRLTADGIEVPGRTSVVGFDNTLISPVVSPPITTIRIPRAQLGQAAVGILLGEERVGAPNARDARLLHYLADHGIPESIGQPFGGDYEPGMVTQIHTSLIVRRSVGPKHP